ncbi:MULTISPECIES: MOSC domain-containing protein [Streptomyces]|uniref:MOSC domain-containing protein n=1 Tax=Streptomyces TaxID=1883 RepID=UPI00136C2E15|nr:MULTISPECIES: MOSC domain-containing protein [Streptomyces]MCX4717769.1 MOSC domain-containing protein [Streptomyces virginiae]MYV74970.1 MOSC domain-containing protein [Streptomyces sp. SID1046]WSC81273.1 MOSC domain-containing protein [Streptomyces virginiae]
MGTLLSLNVGRAHRPAHAHTQETAIGKRPVEGRVGIAAPGKRGTAGSSGSAVAGDQVCDLRNHGGDDQAIYAYGREELDFWERKLRRALPNGIFGENLTTLDVATTDALIGERWQVGPKTVLEVCATRFPCRTFTEWIGSEDWMTQFVQEALPGAYLRVIVPGDIGAGDTISTLSRPEHGVTSGVVFRAMTREPELLPLLAEVEALSAHQRDKAARRARGGARI